MAGVVPELPECWSKIAGTSHSQVQRLSFYPPSPAIRSSLRLLRVLAYFTAVRKEQSDRKRTYDHYEQHNGTAQTNQSGWFPVGLLQA
jgi:hypothetical protein